MTVRSHAKLVAAALCVCAAGVGVAASAAITSGARAELKDAAGKVVGHATAKESKGTLRVSVDVSGLPAGTHGLHVHTVGKCDAPDSTLR